MTDPQTTYHAQRRIEEITARLMKDENGEDIGHLGCPGSRYGSTTRDCAPVAALLAVILEGETGEESDGEYEMGLVVNNHDDPETLIRDYAGQCGVDPADYLD